MVNAAETAGVQGGTKQVAVAGEYVVIGGDIVIALDGIRIKGIDDLSTFLEEYTSPGQLIDATIVRNGVIVTLPVTLGTHP
jgi:serine protease Do